MSEAATKVWSPPAKVECLFEKLKTNNWMALNRPTANVRSQRELESGKEAYQFYTTDSPNGDKVGILLEELEVPYDAHIIDVYKEEQFTSGFTEINPNQKAPAFIDKKPASTSKATAATTPLSIFESGSILLYLADKHNKFIPSADEVEARSQVISWLMWQMGTGPYMGQLDHFFSYVPKTKPDIVEYGVARYGMEAQRWYDVLNKQLERTDSVGGWVTPWGYSIADMAIYPWANAVNVLPGLWEFLSAGNYPYVVKWMKKMENRAAVQKGVNVAKKHSHV